MASVIVVGDGPGGLSAALFLAKKGHEVNVFGTDQTAMNYAYLHNYLGLREIAGTEFQRIAKDQVTCQTPCRDRNAGKESVFVRDMGEDDHSRLLNRCNRNYGLIGFDVDNRRDFPDAEDAPRNHPNRARFNVGFADRKQFAE